ncbi:jg1261, partial [Pararge aegeria aegeria]
IQKAALSLSSDLCQATFGLGKLKRKTNSIPWTINNRLRVRVVGACDTKIA